MPLNKEGIPQPSIINSKKFRDNWDEIFGSIYCFNCGSKLNKIDLKEHSDLYIFHNDGEISHKNCNFN